MREEIVKMANAFAKFLLQHPTLDYRTISDKSDEYFTEHKILSQDKKSFIVGVSANSSFSVQDCKIFSVFGYLLHEDRKQKYNATSYFFGSMLGLQYDYQLFYEYMDIHSNYRQNPLTVTIFDNATSIISFPLELHCSLCINKYGLIASARLHNDVNLSNFSALGSTNLCLKHNITAIKEVECDNSNISQIINTTCHPSPGISSLEQLQQILIPADQNLHDVAVIIVPSTLTLLYCTNNTWNNLSLFGESTDFNL